MQVTTKGGQQALDGIKQQMGTTVGPSSALWDNNPPAVAGSTFASGPGTTLQAFKTRGAGADPSEIKEYRNMAACALDIPPTWMGDMETSNLSTAQTLDRPTELGFLLRQEEWQEDLVVMGRYALGISARAPSGKLRAAMGARKVDKDAVQIREATRVYNMSPLRNNHWIYEAAKDRQPDVVEVMCSFPAIREGDIPLLVKATNDAMAIDRQGNQHGIDDKTAVRLFCGFLDVDNKDELVEKLYPEKSYIHDRTLEPENQGTVPAPTPAALPGVAAPKLTPKESSRIREALERVDRALVARENGHPVNHG